MIAKWERQTWKPLKNLQAPMIQKALRWCWVQNQKDCQSWRSHFISLWNPFTRGFESAGRGWRASICISHQLLSEAHTAGLETRIWKSSLKSFPYTKGRGLSRVEMRKKSRKIRKEKEEDPFTNIPNWRDYRRDNVKKFLTVNIRVNFQIPFYNS